MNWKGWLILGLLILGILGGVGYFVAQDALTAAQLKSYEKPIEQATRGKLDITDIVIEKGNNGKTALYFYIHGETATANPLTEAELEETDEAFLKAVKEQKTDWAVWLWVREDATGEWHIVTASICDVTTLLANRENDAVSADCQTNQTFTLLPKKHLRWLN